MKRLLYSALIGLSAGALSGMAWAQKTAAAPAAKATPSKTVQGTSAYASRPEAMELAAEIAQNRQLPLDWVQTMVGQARFLPQVPRLMTPAPRGTAKNWNVYRSRFIDPIRIRAGLRFWQSHGNTLARAEGQYGVPADIIAGIIGVETVYGQQMGNFRVMDALTTLSLDFPQAHPRAEARRAFFRGELEQFLSMTYSAGIAPFSLLGSYAGAMGLGQFMPSSWVQWAVDFDGDAHIDLFSSPADAIGSVANYFIAHGWKPGMPTHYPVHINAEPAQLAALLAPDILPSFTAAQMQAMGVVLLDGGAEHQGLLALVKLENGSNGTPLYLAGTQNFYAITRYNWSSYYALSVIELADELKAARSAATSR